MTATVRSTLAAGVRTITLDRPECLNAMNRALVRETAEAFEQAMADPATRAIVFTGAGRAFCAGDDLREHRQPPGEAAAREQIEEIQRVTRAMVHGPRPIVGAISGWAVGGGFEWAINCDLSVWGDGARAFFPEVAWGLFVTGAVTTLLPRLVGLQRAKEMMLLGERYDAAALERLGVAWEVVPDGRVLERATEVAARLAALPERAVADMKRALHRAPFADIDTALRIETEATVRGFLDPRTSERISAFAAPPDR